MGWKDLIARQDDLERDPCLRDRDTILAYLEELERLHSRVAVRLSKDDLVPAAARVESISEEQGTFTLGLARSVPRDLDRRQPVELLFPLDGQRFRAQVLYQGRGGYLQVVCRLPEAVYHAERRDALRARFGRMEKAGVTVLEDLFQGRGATGRLVNLSLEGLCMRVERAISIHHDRRLPLGLGLFQNNQPLLVVRIQDLPRSPVVECSGRVAHLDEGPDGLLLGIRLEQMGERERETLTAVLARRLPTFSRGFPRKVRRTAQDLVDMGADEGVPEGEEDLPEEVQAEGGGEVEGGVPAKERLALVKKRCRRILLVQSDDLNRAILAGTLHVDGYRQVKEARTLVEALACTRTGTFDLVILDQEVGSQGAQVILDRLRKLGNLEEVPVVMLAEQADVKTVLMAKAARIDHVQTLPVDYDGEFRQVLNRLLNI